MSPPFKQRLSSLLFLKPAHCFGSRDALRDELWEGLGFSFKSVVDRNQQEPSLWYPYLSISTSRCFILLFHYMSEEGSVDFTPELYVLIYIRFWTKCISIKKIVLNITNCHEWGS